MKMQLSSVAFDKVEVTNSRKTSGGSVVKMKLTATMTNTARKALGVGTDGEEWPPEGEKAGKLKGSFDATSLQLQVKQGQLLEGMNDVDVPITLADSFVWRLEDPKDETNKTVLYSFWARSSSLEAAQLMVGYKFAVGTNESTGMLVYNKPGDGSRVDMTADPNQMALEEGEESEGKAPTHAEKIASRKEESRRKAAVRNNIN